MFDDLFNLAWLILLFHFFCEGQAQCKNDKFKIQVFVMNEIWMLIEKVRAITFTYMKCSITSRIIFC